MSQKQKYIISAFTLISLVFISVNVSKTANAAALRQEQINAILQLLRSFGADSKVLLNVENALTGKAPEYMPPEEKRFCFNFNKNLKIEDRGEDVVALKTALQNEGIISSLALNNYFDEQTASAVSAFQEKYKNEILTPNGLSRGSGYVGPSTRAKLNSLYGCVKTVTLPKFEDRAKTSEDKKVLTDEEKLLVQKEPEPSIEVTYPTVEENTSFQIGKTYTIKLVANIPSKTQVNVYLAKIADSSVYPYMRPSSPRERVMTIYSNYYPNPIIRNQFSLDWTIPSSVQPGNYVIEAELKYPSRNPVQDALETMSATSKLPFKIVSPKPPTVSPQNFY